MFAEMYAPIVVAAVRELLPAAFAVGVAAVLVWLASDWVW